MSVALLPPTAPCPGCGIIRQINPSDIGRSKLCNSCVQKKWNGAAATDWAADGLCAQTDPEAFFPDKGSGTKDPKAICWRCPVRAECLDYALANGDRFGVWGGYSESERRRLANGETVTPQYKPKETVMSDQPMHVENTSAPGRFRREPKPGDGERADLSVARQPLPAGTRALVERIGDQVREHREAHAPKVDQAHPVTPALPTADRAVARAYENSAAADDLVAAIKDTLDVDGLGKTARAALAAIAAWLQARDQHRLNAAKLARIRELEDELARLAAEVGGRPKPAQAGQHECGHCARAFTKRNALTMHERHCKAAAKSA